MKMTRLLKLSKTKQRESRVPVSQNESEHDCSTYNFPPTTRIEEVWDRTVSPTTNQRTHPTKPDLTRSDEPANIKGFLVIPLLPKGN